MPLLMRSPDARSPMGTGRRKLPDALAAIVAFLAALLASSHHWLHMLLISLGVGVGFSALLFDPTARRVMLVLSLAMTALVGWWMWRRPHRALPELLALGVSTAISLGLVGYTVLIHGW